VLLFDDKHPIDNTKFITVSETSDFSQT